MKIGHFAKQFNIPISTVRYYIDMGILTPNKKNTQFDFSAHDMEEMAVIVELKRLKFALEEIGNFMQVLRLYDNRDKDMYVHMSDMYLKKKDALLKEIIEIKETIHILDEKIAHTKKIENKRVAYQGLPLSFVSYLACPNCGDSFSIENVKIENNAIYRGNLFCKCNYSAKIEDGIVIVEEDEDNLVYNQFISDTYKEDGNQFDFVLFHDMKEINSHTSAIMKKTYDWIDKAIMKNKSPNNIIFIPDIASHFLYKYANSAYFQNAYIIVAGASIEVIESIKLHLDAVASHLKVIYIANTLYDLPVEKHSIGLWIDCFSSNNFSFFYKFSLLSRLKDYMNEDASIIGATTYYEKPNQSFHNIKRIYPSAFNFYNMLSTFKSILIKHNYWICNDEILGSSKNPGVFYDYHFEGDKMYFYAFDSNKVASR